MLKASEELNILWSAIWVQKVKSNAGKSSASQKFLVHSSYAADESLLILYHDSKNPQWAHIILNLLIWHWGHPEIVIQNTDSKPYGLELKERNMLNSSQNCNKKFSFYEGINLVHKCNTCSVFDFFL